MFHIGALEVHAFGVAACLAILAGHSLALRRARTLGLDERSMSWIYAGGAVAAAVAGHLWAIAGTAAHTGPFEIWSGQSAAGFTAGALLTILFILWRFGPLRWRYLDALAFAFPFAWTLVRTGCFLAHDHIGAPTASTLGVRFPDGTRFDLGLLEALMALMASLGVVLFLPRLKLPGQMSGFLLLLAGTARLFIAAVSESSSAFTTGFGGVVLTLLGVAILASRQRTTDAGSGRRRRGAGDAVGRRIRFEYR
ncbi:MAG: prolipoprotein diacylglyceryl transferase [Acidobacteriia bacterium]|nr:prolipoprotein diacylglyceryl transferase [Terriglobia bacterium]